MSKGYKVRINNIRIRDKTRLNFGDFLYFSDASKDRDTQPGTNQTESYSTSSYWFMVRSELNTTI